MTFIYCLILMLCAITTGNYLSKLLDCKYKIYRIGNYKQVLKDFGEFVRMTHWFGMISLG